MKTIALLAAILGGTALLTHADADAAVDATTPGRAIVWKVEGKEHTVFLAGSVHLLREEDFPLPPSYDEAYGQAEEVIFEIDIAEMEGLGAAMKMQKLGSYQNGDTVADHISAETVDLLRGFLKERGLPEAMFMKMKPGLLSLTLSSLEAMRIGARPDLGLEMKYGARAKQDGVATGGLETIEYQIGIFDDFTDEESDDLLKSTLESLGDIKESLDELITAWSAGNVEELDTILHSEFEESEKLRKVLLVDRNLNWMPVIESAIAGDRSIMFMVGAGHLVGEDGVIEMLEAKGYKPVQMTFERAAEEKKPAKSGKGKGKGKNKGQKKKPEKAPAGEAVKKAA